MKMVTQLMQALFPRSARYHAVERSQNFSDTMKTKLEEAIKRAEEEAEKRERNDRRIIS